MVRAVVVLFLRVVRFAFCILDGLSCISTFLGGGMLGLLCICLMVRAVLVLFFWGC